MLVFHIYIFLFGLGYDEFRRDEFTFENKQVHIGVEREGPMLQKGSPSSAELHPKSLAKGEIKPTAMPPTSVMTRLILIDHFYRLYL